MEMKSLLLTEKVKRLLSKKDKEKLGMVEEENDLIDNCKYIVYTLSLIHISEPTRLDVI